MSLLQVALEAILPPEARRINARSVSRSGPQDVGVSLDR
jgi:hypothetical protein